VCCGDPLNRQLFADIRAREFNVCFTAETGHHAGESRRPEMTHLGSAAKENSGSGEPALRAEQLKI